MTATEEGDGRKAGLIGRLNFALEVAYQLSESKILDQHTLNMVGTVAAAIAEAVAHIKAEAGSA